MHYAMSRRTFLAASAAGVLGSGAGRATAEPGTRFDRYPSYVDLVTGARVYKIVTGGERNDIVYQTHPMWTPGMAHLVFNSAREGGGMRPYVLTLETGGMRPLLDAWPAGYALTQDGKTVVFVEDRAVRARDVADAAAGKGEARGLGELPPDVAALSGTLSVDATGGVLYAGVALHGEDAWAIMSMDLATGAWTTRAAVDFQVGHTQCHPTNPRYTLFCHETGGFAPQRMWLYDAVSGEHAPFYASRTKEWVTHEVWWGEDRALFTIWPYDDVRRAQPHGIAAVDLSGGNRRILARYPVWHTHGSPDGNWVLGDDFDRNLWLIHVDAGERRLLTQGHTSGDFKTHPHASFSPDSAGILFNSSRDGSEDIFYVPLPEWDSLSRMPVEEPA